MSGDSLRSSESAASRRSAKAAPDDVVVPCPLATSVVEVRVVDKLDQPLAEAPVTLFRDASQLVDVTTSSGIARFAGLGSGSYEVSLLEVDRELWEVVSTESIDPPAESPGSPAWEPSPAAAAETERAVRVSRGEGISSIAYAHGVPVSAIAALTSNARLRERRDDLEALLPGDVLHVPARRPKRESAATNTRITLRRLDVPSRIEVRFLDGEGNARASAQFLLELHTKTGEALPSREGQLDRDGWFKVSVPPDVARANVLLKVDGAMRDYVFYVGEAGPIDTAWGWQTRLRNLGFYAGQITGTFDGPSRAALHAFQRAHGLPLEDEPSAATRTKLKEVHRG